MSPVVPSSGTTIGGVGVLNADLTPECTAIVSAVLDALSAPTGEDTRTHGQRYHDGLQEATRSLCLTELAWLVGTGAGRLSCPP